MINIDFLTPPEKLKRLSGMEYIDYQKDKVFFNELKEFIAGIYDPNTNKLIWNPRNREIVEDIIATHTNMRIFATIGTAFAVQSGFVSPNSVLNTERAEKILSSSDSNVGKFFKEFKRDALTGWCDLKTGKVEGDFKKIGFSMYFPETMDIRTFDVLKITKKDIPMSDIIASAIMHECGHIFFALYEMSSSVLENIFFSKVSAEINKETDNLRKIKIVTEFKRETGIDVSEEVSKTGNLTVMGLRVGLADREYKRTLSLGVAKITPEVLANAYAVRMGAGLSLAAFYATYAKKSNLTFRYLVMLIVGMVIIPLNPIFGNIVVMTYLSRLWFNVYGSLVGTTHETPYRTVKTLLRETIDVLNKARETEDKKLISNLIKEALQIEAIADKAKPFLEGTFVQRLFAKSIHGADAKKIDFEYYTSELLSNPLSIHLQLENK